MGPQAPSNDEINPLEKQLRWANRNVVLTGAFMKLELHTFNVTCLEFRRSSDVNMTPDLTLRVEGLILNNHYDTEGNVDRI